MGSSSTARTPEPDTSIDSELTPRAVKPGAAGSLHGGMLASDVAAVRLNDLLSNPHGAAKASGTAPLPIRTCRSPKVSVVGYSSGSAMLALSSVDRRQAGLLVKRNVTITCTVRASLGSISGTVRTGRAA